MRGHSLYEEKMPWGIPVEFYKSFWSFTNVDMLNLIVWTSHISTVHWMVS